MNPKSKIASLVTQIEIESRHPDFRFLNHDVIMAMSFEKYQGLSGVRACFFGGNANNGANAGFVYANSNNSAANTNANYGSRLYL